MLYHYAGNWRNTCAIAVGIHYGSYQESVAMRGYTHLCDHLMFTGTEKFTHEELQKLFHDRTNGVEATTSRHNVYLWTQFHKSDTDAVVELLSQMLFHWKCPDGEIVNCRKDILQEWDEFQELEERAILEKIHRFVEIHSPNPMGPRSFAGAINKKTIQRAEQHWHKNVMKAPRDVVAIGDFSSKQLDTMEKLFSVQHKSKAAVNWKSSSPKFVVKKNMAGLYFTENARHPLVTVLDRIFYWRWQEGDEFYFYRMYNLQNLTGFFLYNPESLKKAEAREFFARPITREEFFRAHKTLLQYWEGTFDLVDIKDTLYWFHGFDIHSYGPWNIKNPLDAYNFMKNSTFDDVTAFHKRMIENI